MATRMTTHIRSTAVSIVRSALLSSLATAALLAAPAPATDSKPGQADHEHAAASLVQAVRDATRQFIDVNAATAAGYGPFLGCVSGPDHGAMGVHYVNGPLVADGLIEVSKPEALIYEPSDGGLRDRKSTRLNSSHP